LLAVRSCNALLLAGLLLALGCSPKVEDQPELGSVHGVVKLDEKPLPKALVVFAPETGRSSTGVTNDKGEYELQYLFKVRGAVIGAHKVQITTYYEDEDSPAALKSKESIPTKYNSKSELKAEVDAGKNVIDFDLKTK
jgi:hypothetical protein